MNQIAIKVSMFLRNIGFSQGGFGVSLGLLPLGWLVIYRNLYLSYMFLGSVPCHLVASVLVFYLVVLP